MESIKNSIGPFEIFSSFISGIPIVFSFYLLFIPGAKLELNELILKATFSNLMLIIIICYLIGGSVSGISYKFLKLFSKLLRKDHLAIEKSFLENINDIKTKYSKDEFLEMKLEDRIAHLVKIHIGISKLSWVNDRLLPYIQKKEFQLAQKAQNHVAISIMYRNLSLGFLILTFSIITFLFLNKTYASLYYIFPILSLVFSYLAINQAISFRHWWARDVLLGFYYLNIGELANFKTNDEKHNIFE